MRADGSTRGADGFRFSTAGMPVGAAFDAYRSLYAGGADLAIEADDFRADMSSRRFDRLTVHDRRLRSIRHERGPARVRYDDFSHFTLSLCLVGTVYGDDGDGFRAIGPGAFMLLDTSRPTATRLGDARVLTVGIGREIVEAAGGDSGRSHGRIVRPETARPLARYLIGLTDAVPEPDAPPASIVAALLGEILDPDRDHASARLRAQRTIAARRFIETRLEDPDLDAARVADAVGVSRATLYRLFANAGGIGRYIVERRLLRLHRRLEAPGERTSFATLAGEGGFASESHASRAFLSRFGYRPGHVRRTAGRMDDSERAAMCMAVWCHELS